MISTQCCLSCNFVTASNADARLKLPPLIGDLLHCYDFGENLVSRHSPYDIKLVAKAIEHCTCWDRGCKQDWTKLGVNGHPCDPAFQSVFMHEIGVNEVSLLRPSWRNCARQQILLRLSIPISGIHE
eukprot:5219308-Amphidinium_carterae.1